LVPIFLAIAIILADTYHGRLANTKLEEQIISATELKIDATSVSGYEHGLRKQLLPIQGQDGYVWIMYAQQMLHEGTPRIRYTMFDNAPAGREVHWSQSLIWWLILLGGIQSWISGLPWAAGIEAIAPFATVILHLLIVTISPWFLWRRLGVLGAGSFSLALVCASPFSEQFTYGCPDHHSIALFTSMCCTLFLAVGGAGWVVQSTLPNGSLGEKSGQQLVRPQNASGGVRNSGKSISARCSSVENCIDFSEAKKWFRASGWMGAIAIWVSAAAAIPTFAAIGVGVVASCLVFGGRRSNSSVVYVPQLWRVWSRSGAIGSLFFYLLEYFPNHLGVRLEVNHPFFALAWLGAGELLYLGSLTRVQGSAVLKEPKHLAFMVFGVLSLLPPVIGVMGFPEQTFWIKDRFLWQLHHEYIFEFSTFWDWLPRVGDWRTVMRLLVFIAVALLTIRLLFSRFVDRSWKGTLLLVASPAIVFTLLGMMQIRWFCFCHAGWIAVFPICMAVFSQSQLSMRWHISERIVGYGLAAFYLSFSPVCTLQTVIRSIWTNHYEVSSLVMTTIPIRNLAHTLKSGDPTKQKIFVSDASVALWFAYFGGMRSVGTLYWENLNGLKTAGELFSAKTEEEAKEIIQRNEISYIYTPDGPGTPMALACLWRGLPIKTEIKDAYISSMLQSGSIPTWFSPVGCPEAKNTSPNCMLAEIKFNQTQVSSLIGLSKFHIAQNNAPEAAKNLEAALAIESNNSDALMLLGSLRILMQGADAAWSMFQQGLEGRTIEDISQICFKAAEDCMLNDRHRDAVRCLKYGLEVNPSDTRVADRLAWILSNTDEAPLRDTERGLELAKANSSNPDVAKYLDTLAAALASNEQFDEAVEQAQKAIEILTANGRRNEKLLLKAVEGRLELYQKKVAFRIKKTR
jgi:tetratricopeptide (TPR) repeat protein